MYGDRSAYYQKAFFAFWAINFSSMQTKINNKKLLRNKFISLTNQYSFVIKKGSAENLEKE